LLQGVIFDVDGMLVDSNDAHAQSWVDTFAEAGYDVPFEVVRPLIGMGSMAGGEAPIGWQTTCCG
jgi:beta-phosphoglucomutase-like phosphatase (HAD superfamily)